MGRKAGRSLAMEKLARDLRTHLLQQSGHVVSSQSPQQRKPEWECRCGCTNFLDRTCCRKCGAARTTNLQTQLSRGAVSDHRPSRAVGGTRGVGPHQGHVGTARLPAAQPTAVGVADLAVPSERGCSWELALAAVSKLGASDELTEELTSAILREWESAEPTNPRFNTPLTSAAVKVRALRGRLSDARWCVKIAERAGLADGAVAALRRDVQQLERDLEENKPPGIRVGLACGKAKAAWSRHKEAAARLTKLEEEVVTLDAQRLSLVHSVEQAVGEAAGARKAAMEATLDKGRAVLSALQGDGPAAPSLNQAHFLQIEANLFDAVNGFVATQQHGEDSDIHALAALAEQAEIGHRAWAEKSGATKRSALQVAFAKQVPVAEPAEALSHPAPCGKAVTSPAATSARSFATVVRGRSSSPCQGRRESRSRSVPARAAHECSEATHGAAKADSSTPLGKRGGGGFPSPAGKVTKADCPQAERSQQSACFLDEGYDDSLYDSGEDDHKLKVVHSSNTIARESKLTKAERLQFERQKQQWDAAIATDPGEDRYDRYDVHIGDDVWN